MKNSNAKLRLNIPRTVLVGLAFFTITMFWQVYDNIMPLFLLDFGFGETMTGVIMSLDNVLAVVLLPFMGLMSDRFPMKLRSKIGRRMPFIVLGSVLAGVLFLLVNMAHNMHAKALMIVLTAFVLVFMCLYRTPAVSLMPDVTPKPIRSNANAIINVMGTIGGVISLLLMNILLKYETVDGVKFLVGNNWILISVISGMMILASIVMIIKVRENKYAEESAKIMEKLGIKEDDEKAKEKTSVKKVLGSLTRPQLKSLIFILLSVFLWYMAYNALTTHFSRFSLQVLGSEFTQPLLVANAAAFVMFMPSVEIAKRIGRKKTVMIGVAMMAVGLLLGSTFLLTTEMSVVKIAMYPTFILVGGGWATINVHSFVMCVELSEEHTTGTYTGLYYAFTMTAQIVTPILSGLVMEHLSPLLLVPYAMVFCILALVTMIFVRHGNANIPTEEIEEQLPYDLLDTIDQLDDEDDETETDEKKE